NADLTLLMLVAAASAAFVASTYVGVTVMRRRQGQIGRISASGWASPRPNRTPRGVLTRRERLKCCLMPSRRFPPPWTVEEYCGISYIVRDAAVAYVYFENEPGRRAVMSKDEERKIAAGIAKLPELLMRPQY